MIRQLSDCSAKTQDCPDKSRHQVAELTKAIARFDSLDFTPLFSIREGEATEAEIVLRTFDQVVPQAHWFHLFENLLELRGEGEKPSALSHRLSALSSQPSALSEDTCGVLTDS